MSEQGLEVIESTTQKTHEWIARMAEITGLGKAGTYKALRAVLQTIRDRLPLDEAVHVGAQLPILLRGVYYEGWQPAKVPIKFSLEEFLQEVSSKIITDHPVDAITITQDILAGLGGYVGEHVIEKIRHCFPAEFEVLWPEFSASLG